MLPLSLWAQANRAAAVLPAAPIAVKRGGTIDQNLVVDVRPGFHVNSNKPKDEFIIPLKLTWTGGPLVAEKITYPKAEDMKIGDQVLSVFTGKFTIQTAFKAPEQAPASSQSMTGKLRYQACDNRMCLRPVTVDVQVTVTIE